MLERECQTFQNHVVVFVSGMVVEAFGIIIQVLAVSKHHNLATKDYFQFFEI